MLTRRLAIGVSAALTVALASPSYAAGQDGCENEFVCVDVSAPGTPGGTKPGGGHSGGTPASSKAKPPECSPPQKLDPQPPANSELWEGHDPSDGGAVYMRTCRYFMENGASTMLTETLYGGPGGPPAAPAVDPAQLAQQAVDKMRLRAPDIGITPKPGGKGVVGMPVYLWTATGPETYGPNTASASAGGITVTATAKVSKIEWNMGDGTTVTCTTSGTPYKPEYGKKPSPDCGHRYNVPSSTTDSGKFHVTATSTWTIDWQVTGGAQTGQLTEVRNSAVDITVAEVQVLN